MTIIYQVHNSLYVNLTNRCPCACTFCLRQNSDGVYGSDSLWLEHEPTIEEIKEAFKSWDLSLFDELVFCGYGEPTERLDDLLEVVHWVRSFSAIPTRINTNGLSDLMYEKRTAPLLQGLIDTVSISLNAPTAEEFLELTRSKFGIGSFDAMLQFAKDCTGYVPNVVLTIVDVVTSPEEQEACRKIAQSVGATLRIRPYED